MLERKGSWEEAAGFKHALKVYTWADARKQRLQRQWMESLPC